MSWIAIQETNRVNDRAASSPPSGEEASRPYLHFRYSKHRTQPVLTWSSLCPDFVEINLSTIPSGNRKLQQITSCSGFSGVIAVGHAIVELGRAWALLSRTGPRRAQDNSSPKQSVGAFCFATRMSVLSQIEPQGPACAPPKIVSAHLPRCDAVRRRPGKRTHSGP